MAATAARAQTTATCRRNRRTSSSAAGKARAGVEAKTVRVAKVMVASKGGQCLTQLKVKAMAKAKAKARKHQCHKQMDKHHAPAPAPCSLAQLPCKLAVGHQSFMSKDFQSQVRWMHWPSSLHPHQILWVTSTKTQPSGCCERKPSLIMAEARRAKTVRVAKVLSDTAQGGGQQPRVRMPRRGLAITEDEVRDEYAFRRASVSDLC